MRIVYHIVILLCLSSCYQPESDIAKEDIFFPLKEFLQDEIDRNGSSLSVQKTVQYNSKKESKQISNFDLSKDLQSFINSDINKISWKDKYKADTSTVNNQVTYRYTSLSDKMRCKELIIIKKNDQVQEVSIHNSASSVLKSSTEVLRYFPSKGYIINFDQKLTRGEATKSFIKVDFIP